MINYGMKPSNQNQMSFADGFDLMQEVRQWVKEHPKEWSRYLDIVRQESRYGAMSPNYAIQILRHRYHVSIRNAYAPALARIAMEHDRGVQFRLAKSKCDGFCEVRL